MDLAERVKSILLSPKTEWRVIEREPDTIAGLFKNYVAILAAIPAICGFIGIALIGVTVPVAGTIQVPTMVALVSAILGYLLSFVMVYVLGYIINMWAPTFGGVSDQRNALKVAAYAYTPGWLVGVFMLIPALGFLGILSLYGLYLVWTGLPVMMKAPQDRALGYTASVVGVALVMTIVIALVQNALIDI